MAQTKVMPDVLTDEEINQLEQSSSMPDVLTDDQIAGYESNEQEPNAKEPGFLERTVDRVKGVAAPFVDKTGKYYNPNAPEAMQGISRVAGAGLKARSAIGGTAVDLLGSVISPLAKKAAEGYGQIAEIVKPGAIEGIKKGISNVGKDIAQSEFGQAVKRTTETPEWQQAFGSETGKEFWGDVANASMVTPGAVKGLKALAKGAVGEGTLINKATTAAGEQLKKQAARTTKSKMRPGQVGTNLGYNAEAQVKYGLFGKPREVYEQAGKVLNDLRTQANAIGESSTETVNMPGIIQRARAGLDRAKDVHHFDQKSALLDQLESTYQKAFENPDISLQQAMDLRTQIGDETAFVGRRDVGGSMVDPDANWKEEVFNDLYREIKDEIQAKAGPELQKINRMQMEIIPIRQVAFRRMPISESNLRAGLSDFGAGTIGAVIGAASGGSEQDRAVKGFAGAVGAAALRRIGGSKLFTKGLYNLGEKLSPMVEKPLRELDKGKYPSGIEWKFKPNKEAPAVNPSAENPFWNLSKTKKEANAAYEAENQPTVHPEEIEATTAERMTPEEAAEQFDKEDMEAAGPEPIEVSKDLGQELRKAFGFSTRRDFEINAKRLPEDKQKLLSNFAERINTLHDTDYPKWESDFGQYGYPDRGDLSADDLVEMMNGTYKTKRRGGYYTPLGTYPTTRGISLTPTRAAK
jgi:hypothetical protein